MATEALRTPNSLPRPFYRPVNRTVERSFFAGMAILLCVVVVIGFTPTYFGAGMLRAPLPSPILHFHGAAFTLWMVLYLVQSALISARRVAWHRSLGTIAFCLPPIMIVLGLIAAIDAFHRGVRIGPLEPTVSLAIPLLGIVSFAIADCSFIAHIQSARQRIGTPQIEYRWLSFAVSRHRFRGFIVWRNNQHPAIRAGVFIGIGQRDAGTAIKNRSPG